MKLIQEFKEFAVKGNMIDMAIGIIIGASFNKVIDVLVKKVLLPPLSLLSDGINLESKKIILRESQTNSEGEFSIKIPIGKINGQLMLSYIGYKNKVINLKELKAENNLIILDPYNIALNEVIVSTNDAELLLKKVLQKSIFL